MDPHTNRWIRMVRQMRWWSMMLCLLGSTGFLWFGACSPTTGECQGDGSCAPPTPFCVANKCVACRGNSDCLPAQTCSSGTCTGGAVEVSPEPEQETASVPEESVESKEDAGTTVEEETQEESTGDTSNPSESQAEPTQETNVTKEPEPTSETVANEQTPEQKVVKPPQLPAPVSACSNPSECCVPTQLAGIFSAHTPNYPARSWWSVARWSKDNKILALVAGDSPKIWLRKGTTAKDPYTNDRVLEGHTGGLLSVAISPDGKYIAASGYDYKVIVWQLSDSKQLYSLTGHSAPVYNLTFSPDNTLLISSGSSDRTVRLWKMSDGKLQRSISTASTVWDVAISPDGKTLATGLDNNRVELWNVSDGKSIKVLSGHNARVRFVSWSPDGSKIASGSDDDSAILWDATAGTALRTLKGHTSDVYDVKFSPDGKLLATTSPDLNVRIWDIATGQTLQTLRHESHVVSVDWSSDSKYVLTASFEKTARIWDATTATLVRRIPIDEIFRNSIATDASGKYVAHADIDSKDIQLWDGKTRKLLYTLQGHSERVTSLSLSPDGEYLVSGSVDKTAKIWRLRDGKMLYDLNRHKALVNAVAFDPTGKTIATAGRDSKINLWQAVDGKWLQEFDMGADVRALAWNPAGTMLAATVGLTLRILQSKDGQVLHNFTHPKGYSDALTWSPQTNRLAVGSWDRYIYVYSTLSWAMTLNWNAHSYGVAALAFSPDGQDLASASVDGTVRIWNPNSVERKHIFYGQTGTTALTYGPQKGQLMTAAWDGTLRTWRIQDNSQVIQVGEKIRALAVSSNNMWVAVGLDSGMVGIWGLSDGKLMGKFEAHADIVRGLSFSPDGVWLASSSDDQMIHLWNLSKGTLERTLKGHLDRVYRVRFRADGKQLASAARDSSVRLWDPTTGKMTAKLEGATGALLDVTYSPDGKYIAAAGFNGRVYVWQTSDNQLYATFSGHLGGALSVLFRNNNELLSSALDSQIRYWRISDQSAIRTLSGHSGPVFDMALNPDAAFFATASEDQTLRLWRSSDGLLFSTATGHQGAINAVTSTSDGRWVTASDDGTIRIWNSLYLRQDHVQTNLAFGVTSTSFSRDQKYLLTTGADRRPKLYQLSNGSLVRTFYGTVQAVHAGTINSDGSYVAYGGEDTYFRVYQASNGASYGSAKYDEPVTAIQYSYDDKLILSGTTKGVLKLWDVATKSFTQELKGHVGAVHTIAVNEDGKIWLTASTEGPIQLWQSADLKKLQSWPKQNADIVSAAMTPKADKVAGVFASDVIKIWQASDGKELKSIKAPSPVISVQFGGNGAWLIASLQDKSLVVWDTKQYQEVYKLPAQPFPLLGLTTTPDGKWLAAGDLSGTVNVWSCP